MPNTYKIQGPNLSPFTKGPLQAIENKIFSSQIDVEKWFQQRFNTHTAPLYSSVDLRNAGFKVAPVDTNLFPAGFNNLSPDCLPGCVQAIQSTLQEISKDITKIILIPEDHTRNLYYYENISVIRQIFTQAGFEVRIGSLLPNLEETLSIELPSEVTIMLEPLKRSGNEVEVNGFNPSVIILNNDLSAGIPVIFNDLNQKIIPPLSAGWHSRLKSNHFKQYRQVAEEFGNVFSFDPWLISPLFRYCGEVNFMAKGGEECVINHAKDLFTEIRQKYDEYNISLEPYLVVKADAGTYGMAVTMIKDPEELLRLNRKERTRMASIKGGREVNQVILQEGVYTAETAGEENAVAEPVIYQIGQHVVGGFYRVHANKTPTENLNAPGMHFQPFPMTTLCQQDEVSELTSPEKFYLYSVIARLASLAASRELEASSCT